ncbi:CubicO group peptidase (beta-lactamase class C family) [Altererythrobacter atlanticus]|uniref:Beta-lactamase n=1 Tax=Croceibacterium atlanticum TaxID=1267766 RepID=A0A0F7KVD5_9SPHN|nr:serine hydrolase domain-containing protein [Croceibacterium atlanticum]AKH43197.1 Beta-lactamase precursor [Croceibacterium atlanticum]MBB5732098.1 CubicO group peptidase (beta-lactamase class C family) [Croceibacterium atlanticum]
MAQAELDETLAARGGEFPLRGRYDERFRPVVDAFIENFREEEELGAAASIVLDGKCVVDLWGGWARADRTEEWRENSLVCMMSVAKGVTAICFNKLIERGLVDPDEKVATYWPEFAQNGKQDITVRMVLDHTAGIPVLTDDVMQPGGFFDYPAYIRALEAQHPLWKPGTRAAYHVHNQGFLLGEIMRRVTGMTVGPYLRANVAGPLRAEYWIGGMTPDEEARVAEVLPNTGARLFAAKDQAVPDKPDTPEGWQDGAVLRSFAFLQNPDEPWHDTMNSHGWRQVEIASGSGHGNARGVARIYGATVGRVSGISLLSADQLEAMIAEQHNQMELLQDRPYHQGMGVLLNTPEAVYMGPNPRSFGHHGLGGSLGFGDPDAKLGFSYCCNQMHAVGTNGPRARRLIDAAYEVMG